MQWCPAQQSLAPGRHRCQSIAEKSVIIPGLPVRRIIDHAGEKAIDIIAMSTHGRSGIGHRVFGSVTDKFLRAGDTAVLVVRTYDG